MLAIHRVLLSGFVAGCCLLAFVLPPFQAPDEPSHWRNALTRIATLESGDEMCSTSLALEQLLPTANVTWNPMGSFPSGRFRESPGIAPVCVKSPGIYGSVVSYPGALLSAPFYPLRHTDGRSSLLYFYSSRLFGGLLLTLLMWRVVLSMFRSTLMVVPGCLAILVLALAPTFLQQSAAISADGIVNAAVLSLLVLMYSGSRVRWFDLILFLALGMAASVTKPVIVPLLLSGSIFLIVNLLDREDGGGWKVVDRPRFWMAVISILLLVTATMWSRLSGDTVALADLPKPNYPVDAKLQIAFAFANPLETVSALWKSSIATILTMPTTASVMGWLEANPVAGGVRRWWYAMLLAILVDAILLIRAVRLAEPVDARKRRTVFLRAGLSLVVIVVAVVASMLATSLYLYLIWSPVGAGEVSGLQFRYFYPQLFVLLALPWAICSLFLTRSVASPHSANPAIEASSVTSGLVCVVVAGLIVGHLVDIYVGLAMRYW